MVTAMPSYSELEKAMANKTRLIILLIFAARAEMTAPVLTFLCLVVTF